MRVLRSQQTTTSKSARRSSCYSSLTVLVAKAQPTPCRLSQCHRYSSCPCHTCRYLAELELRLHLASEDVDAALEIDSGRALQRIPAAVEEVAHVQVVAYTGSAHRSYPTMHPFCPSEHSHTAGLHGMCERV